MPSMQSNIPQQPIKSAVLPPKATAPAAPKPAATFKPPATPAKPKKVKAEVLVRPIDYPELTVCGITIPPERLVIDSAMAKQLLRWETASEYMARMIALNPDLAATLTAEEKDKTWRFPKKDEYGNPVVIFTQDINGEDVVCWNNVRNRPLTLSDVQKYAQDILNRKWADSRNGDKLTTNGETIVIGRTGIVLSGQHRLAALILACEEWHGPQNIHWRSIWPEEPTIEALVVCGVDETQRTVMTLDNVKTRTESDTFYTSDVFQSYEPGERKQLCKIMSNAVDLLWKRTRQDECNRWCKIQTHSESIAFRERHDKIKKCVEHLWHCNSEKAISLLKLWSGHMAALMYLMASSKSDGDVYRNMEPPSEKKLVFGDTMEQSEEFFVQLSKAGERNDAGDLTEEASPLHQVVSAALAADEEDNTLSTEERHAVIVKAWLTWKDLGVRGKVEPADLDLTDCRTWSDTQGKFLVTEVPTVGGIDLGPKKSEPKSEEEEEKEQKEIKEEEEAPKPKRLSLSQVQAKLEEAKKQSAQRKVEEAKANGKASPAKPAPKPTAKK